MSVAEEYGNDPVRAAAASDKAFVDQVLSELREHAEQWEKLLAAQESVRFTADLGDVYAVCDQDGRLVEFALAPDVITSYTASELMDRLNAAFDALRHEVMAEFERNYGDGRIV